MRGFCAWVVVVVACVGCSRTFSGRAVQPNPLASPLETLPESETITIVRGDMDLEAPETPTGAGSTAVARNHKYPLLNQASFSIVSRDRLRFHVRIDHKWQEWADLNTWDVWLEDGEGHVWRPEGVEGARTKMVTTMWDREQRSAICGGDPRHAYNGAGDCYHTIGYADDGHKRRMTLGSLSVFRGSADFSFYQRDIFSPRVRQMKLVVARTGEAFEFVWNFDDSVASR